MKIILHRLLLLLLCCASAGNALAAAHRSQAPRKTAIVPPVAAPLTAPAPNPDSELWLAAAEKLAHHGVELNLSPKDLQRLFHKDAMDTSSFPVQFFDGKTTLHGRVEIKGSFTRIFAKKSLLITLDKGEDWHGKRRLVLDAMATDVTQMHWWLSHDLMDRLKMVVPEMLFTELRINGEDIGRYLLVEWVEPSMFDRFGLGADGELYHPDDAFFCGGFKPQDMPRLEQCFFRLDQRHGSYDRLRQLIQAANDTPADQFDQFAEQYFDVDSLINWLVVNTLTGNEDSYNKNFFLYFSKVSQKWTVVPWDYDLTFGRTADEGLPYPRTHYNEAFQYLHSPEAGASSPLKEKTLKNKALYRRFQARIRELLAAEPLQPGSARGWYYPANFGPYVEQQRAAARASIAAEKYPNLEKAAFEEIYDSLSFFNEWRYQYLNQLILSGTIWNTPLWLPYSSYEPLAELPADYYRKRQRLPLDLVATRRITQEGSRVFLSDSRLGRPLAALSVLSLSKPTRLDIQVAMEQPPASVPPGLDVGNCLERSWYLSNRSEDSQFSADLELDFLNEGTLRHELGSQVSNEAGLVLWLNGGNGWQPLHSSINRRSNSFVVKDLVLDSGSYTLVACIPKGYQPPAAAADKLLAEPLRAPRTPFKPAPDETPAPRDDGLLRLPAPSADEASLTRRKLTAQPGKQPKLRTPAPAKSAPRAAALPSLHRAPPSMKSMH